MRLTQSELNQTHLVYDPGPCPAPLIMDLAKLLVQWIPENQKGAIEMLTLAALAVKMSVTAEFEHSRYTTWNSRTELETDMIRDLCTTISLLAQDVRKGYFFGEVPGTNHYYGFWDELYQATASRLVESEPDTPMDLLPDEERS